MGTLDTIRGQKAYHKPVGAHAWTWLKCSFETVSERHDVVLTVLSSSHWNEMAKRG